MLPLKSKAAKLLFCAAAIITLGVLSFRGCGDRSNSLRQWGFPVEDSGVVLDESKYNLKGEERFLKANLTAAQANALHKAFQSQPAAQMPPYSPKALELKLDDPQWAPSQVQQSWTGNFGKVDELNSLFHCQYIFDIKNPDHIVLYFYVITFDD